MPERILSTGKPPRSDADARASGNYHARVLTAGMPPGDGEPPDAPMGRRTSIEARSSTGNRPSAEHRGTPLGRSVTAVGLGADDVDVAMLEGDAPLTPSHSPEGGNGWFHSQSVAFLGFPFGWDSGAEAVNGGFPMPRSGLPFGSEFSPAQIDLPVLLKLAHEHVADSRAFEEVGSGAICCSGSLLHPLAPLEGLSDSNIRNAHSRPHMSEERRV